MNAIQELIKAYEAHAEQLRQMIAEACALADEVDTEFCSRLSALERDSVALTRPGSDFAPGLPAAPLADWSPTEVSVWWAALSETERRALIENDPELYGSLDGIPAVDRDRANRMVLDELLANPEYDQAIQRIYEAQLELAEFDRLQYGNHIIGPTLESARQQYMLENPFYADLVAIRDALDAAEDRQLLVLDYHHGNIEAAVGIGDLDQAKNVLVHTPGILTNLRGGLSGGIVELDRVLYQAGIDSDEPAAGVYWIDYDVPQTLPGASDTRPFQAGGEKLSLFLEGLHVVRDMNGADIHLTGSGHSYGSTNLGVALDQSKVGVVDDAVFLGSPGMGVEDARDLNIDGGEVFASLIPGDGVGGIGGAHPSGDFGRNPMHDDHVTQISNEGSKPLGEPYGPSLLGTKQHTDYFVPREGSETNPVITDLAEIVVSDS